MEPKFIIFLTLMGITYAQNVWYASNATDILYLTEARSSQPVSLHHDKDGRIVGLAVDVAKNLIFWSDISLLRRGIYKGTLNGGNVLTNVEKIVSEDLGEVNGIAVDWKQNLVYWTDSKKRSIEVSKYDGTIRHVLPIFGLLQPRGIFADPDTESLYWNDQGTRKIEKASLDGSSRVLIESGSGNSGPYWPNQMTVRNKKLYVVDGYNLNIVEYNLANNNSKNEIGKLANLGASAQTNPPFGIAVDDSFAYVSIWYTGKIVKYSLDKNNPNDGKFFQNLGINAIFSVLKSSTQSQSGQNSCSGKTCNGGICLAGRCACQSLGTGSPKTLNANKDACVVPDNLLFYALGEEGIVGYKSLDGSSDDNDLYIVGRSTRPVAVAYDSVKGHVYWSDVHERNVHRSNLDGTGHTIFMSSTTHSIGVVDGLAIDLVHRNLYYTNMGTVKVHTLTHRWHKIEFINLDGKNRRKTIVETAEKPRALYVDSSDGHLYYTGWGSKPAIVRVGLDGKNPIVLRTAGLDNPNAVTVINSEIYVVDSHYKTRNSFNTKYPRKNLDGAIYKMKKDGSNWTEVSGTSLKTPFALTSFNNQLYVSDWDKSSILKINSGSQSNFMVNVKDPMAVVYSRRTTNPGSNPCSSFGCNEVCVVSSGQKQCTCDSYNALVTNTNNNKACILPNDFILVSDFNSIKLINQDGSGKPGNHLVNPEVAISGSSYFSNYVAMAFDKAQSIIYYTDVYKKAIYLSKLDGSLTRMFYEANKTIDGMDLNNNKLYWTAFSEGAIYETDLTTNATKSIVKGLSRPRAIKVTDNDIYWTEWGSTPRVAKTSKTSPGSVTPITLDGNFNLVRPNGLDVDVNDNKLYIGEGSDNPKIIECSLTGKACKNILTRGNGPKHIYSVKKFANEIYFTDWERGTLSLLHITSQTVIDVARNLMRPTEILLNLGTVPACPGGNGCSDYCESYKGGYFCYCNAGETLNIDQKSCVQSRYINCEKTTCGTCQGNEVCAQKTVQESCGCVCKPGYTKTGSTCVQCSSNQYKQYKGDEPCKTCPGSTQADDSRTGCKCSGGNAWNWKTEQCMSTKTGSCPSTSFPRTCSSDGCTADKDCKLASKCCSCEGSKKCSDPVLSSNTYSECIYNGVVYTEGDDFNPNGAPCITCTCRRDKTYGNPSFGNAECHFKDCPVLDCAVSEQVLKPGHCCSTCELKCIQQPVTITECQSGSMLIERNLPKGQSSLEPKITLTGRDNCKKGRDIKITTNQADVYVWRKEAYDITATAEALKLDNTKDTFTCKIKLKVKDTFAPVFSSCSSTAQTYIESNECVTLRPPSFSDNVCGTPNQDSCSVSKEGEPCVTLKSSTSPVSATFNVEDGEGNKATCTYPINVTPKPNIPCTPPQIDSGTFTCTDNKCKITCNQDYNTVLIENVVDYTCNGGSWSPVLPDGVQQRACLKPQSLKIIGALKFTDLTCPTYLPKIIALGLRETIQGPRYCYNTTLVKNGTPMTVSVITSGCSTSKSKRNTNDFTLDIEFIAEANDPSKETPAKTDVRSVMSQVSDDIRNGILTWQGAPRAGGITSPQETVPVKGCEKGQVKVTITSPNGANVENCVNCPAGTSQESDKCVACKKNTYNNQEKSPYCFACPDGKVTKEKGASLLQQCIVEEAPPPTSNGSNIIPIIIGVVVAMAVASIIIIIIAVVMYKRKSGNNVKSTPPTNFANPAFVDEAKGGVGYGEEGIYMDPPPVSDDAEYEGLDKTRPTKQDTLYAGLQP